MYIRDAIHGDIEFNNNEIQLINKCIWIQRLHYIKQMGLLFLIYPNAHHSRFSHSLGVLYLTDKYITHLAKHNNTILKYAQALRLAALLHDVGHGPFSHAWENALWSDFDYTGTINAEENLFNTPITISISKWHDYIRIHIVKDIEKQGLLQAFDLTANDIIACWYHPLYRQIIQGTWGADRLDYMMRDSYFCGTQHFNRFAMERIIHNSYTSVDSAKLLYLDKIEDDLKHAMDIRDFMYKHLCFHKKNVQIEKQLEEFYQKKYNKQFLIDLENNLEPYHELTDDYVLKHYKKFLYKSR